MPEAGASRKRQIWVTRGPFGGVAASGADLTPNRVPPGSFPGLFTGPFDGFAIFSASRMARVIFNAMEIRRSSSHDFPSVHLLSAESNVVAFSDASVPPDSAGARDLIHLESGSSGTRSERIGLSRRDAMRFEP